MAVRPPGSLNVCEAGHETHQSRQVETLYGPLWIWDWEQYQGQPLYCTGQDEVSKSIDLQTVWERHDSRHMHQLLTDRPGPVLDFGSHIGWFTVLAALTGSPVLAVDADPENMRLLKRNVELRNVQNRVTGLLAWVKDLEAPLGDLEDIRLCKVDTEGHEDEVLDATRRLWQERKVDLGLWELSPIFEQREGIMAASYKTLVDEIASYGYRWYLEGQGGKRFITSADLTFPQETAWAVKIP